MIRVRELTETEREEIDRRFRRRTLAHRAVQRATMVSLNAQGMPATQIGKRLGISAISVRVWLKRFNEQGLDGLEDRRRAGRPRPDLDPYRTALIRLARTVPTNPGLPFAVWTIERLQTALNEETGRLFSTQTIWSWLKKEGLNWRRQQSWLRPELNTPEAVEEFDEKRGTSSKPTERLKHPPARPPSSG